MNIDAAKKIEGFHSLTDIKFIEERLLNNSDYNKFEYIVDSKHFFILIRPISRRNSITKQHFAIIPIRKNKNNLKLLDSINSINQLLGYTIPNVIKVNDLN